MAIFSISLPDLLYIPLKIFIVSVLDTMSFLPRKEFLIWLLLYFLIFFFFPLSIPSILQVWYFLFE